MMRIVLLVGMIYREIFFGSELGREIQGLLVFNLSTNKVESINLKANISLTGNVDNSACTGFIKSDNHIDFVAHYNIS